MKDYIVFYSAINTAKTIEDLTPALERLSGNNALRMLNAKYFILMPEMDPVVNSKALGNCWFADTVIFAGNANQELSLLNRIDPGWQAVADIRFKETIKNSSFRGTGSDKISLVSYKPNELIYKASSVSERLAVFSEIYYPAGWKAYIDGKESDHVRVNYLLRSMVVPAGDHEIRFSFKPESYFTGNKISFASSVIFILMAAGYLVWSFIRRRKNSENGSVQ
jgi:Bacterial membrane protein YfhO